MTTTLPPDATSRADEAVREVLTMHLAGVPAVRVDSPPGAGKTRLVEYLAVQTRDVLGLRCAVATQTNEQALDLTRRLARAYAGTVHLFTRKSLRLPPDLHAAPNVAFVRSSSELPCGPCIVVANAAKWSWVQEPFPSFDLLVVDEAFQLPDYRFHLIAGLAPRFVLVGDPGQIAPVVTCELERWRGSPTGPHLPCPDVLLARHPHLRRVSLPVSRRLPPDSVGVVQPAFYPGHPFVSAASRRDRALVTKPLGGAAVDPLIDAMCGGSLTVAELPDRIMGEVDEGLSGLLADLCARLVQRGGRLHDDGEERPLGPESIGIVCAHVAQVNAVRERLPTGFDGVLVETADRFQGLERPIVLVHHPLSGRADASAFHLDAGRLCVMMSRHRVGCVLVVRAGLDRMLRLHAPVSDRVLGVDNDPEYEGWRAHTRVLRALRGRTLSVTA